MQCYFYFYVLYCNHDYKVVVIMDRSKEIEMYLIKVISYDFVIIVQCFFLVEMTVIDVFNRQK